MLFARFGALFAVMCLAAAPARASVITLPAGGSITFGDDLIQCSGGPVVDNCSDTNVNGALGLIKTCVAAGYGATYCIQQTNQQSNPALGCIAFTQQCVQLCTAAGYAFPSCQTTCTSK